MIRLLLKIGIAFLSTGGGFYIAYVFVKSLDSGGNPILLIPSLILIVFGIYLLLQAGKSNDSVIAKGKEILPPSQQNFGEVLERNNKIVKDWSNTDQLRTKLKTMQVAAEEGNTPSS